MTAIRVVFAMSAIAAASAAGGQLNDGDTVVFLGDSITSQGAGPSGYVTLFRQAIDTKRPRSGIRIIGAGISGHKVPDLEKRLDQDVLRHNPDVVVIYIGINDVWHSIRNQGTEIGRYETGLRSLIRRCRNVGTRVILATPSIIGEKHDGTNDLDSMLDDYSNVSRRVANECGAQLLELRKAFVDHLKHYNTAGEEKGILTTDGVHLSEAGNRFVAARMLEAAGEVPVQKRVLRHHVYFRFSDNITAADVDRISRAFHDLKYRIPTIVDFECGVNNSPEGKSNGFTHAYIVTFASEEGRDAYLPHPAHRKFVSLVSGKLDDVFVVDYWAVE